METFKESWTVAYQNNLPDSAFLFIESGGKKDADGRTVPRSKRHFPYKDASGKVDLPHLRNALARIPQSNAPGLNKDAVTKRAQSLLKSAHKETSVFTVFKDAKGADRWLAVTTTAYEDKDEEIISTKAIAKAVAIGDLTEQRGPLRYWHVRGMDIGDCDYQATAQDGRFLIESGTFRGPAYARMGRTMAAKGYQMSPGFIHPRSQPTRGVYDDIAIVERSPVPQARASNLFTRFTSKGDCMLTTEKETELKALLVDQPDLLQELLSRVETTDKAAQAAQIAYKDAPDWAQAILTRLDALEAREKAAAPPPMEGSPEEEAAETPEEEAMEPDAQDGGMDDTAFAQMIAQAVVQAITPMFDFAKKMDGHMSDLKSAMGAFSAQKDAGQAELKAQVATLAQQVKEIAVGDLPQSIADGVLTSARGMYRPSEAASTLIPEATAATIKETMGGVPSGLSGAEADAYRLIFGN